MDAPQEPTPAEWLTREQIDQVVAAISADDLIESGLVDAGDDKNLALKAAKAAFNSAAAFIGVSNGSPASRHVHPRDLTYWSEAITEGVSVTSPKRKGRKR